MTEANTDSNSSDLIGPCHSGDVPKPTRTVIPTQHRSLQSLEVPASTTFGIWAYRDACKPDCGMLYLVTQQKEIKTKGVVWQIGRLTLWLRNRWLLQTIIFAAALTIAIVPRWWIVDDKMPPEAIRFTTIMGAAAAVAVLADKVADHHSAKLAQQLVRAEESVGHKAIASINAILDKILDAAVHDGESRRAALYSLRVQLAAAATELSSVTSIRGTYYPMRYDAEGNRILDDPKSHGREDKATTVFFEKGDPTNSVWSVMNEPDWKCEMRSKPDECGVDWDSKPYDTFISVPVQANGVCFGMLSINALNEGDLTELDRVATISLARIMATLLALDHGPRIFDQVSPGQDALPIPLNESPPTDLGSKPPEHYGEGTQDASPAMEEDTA